MNKQQKAEEVEEEAFLAVRRLYRQNKEWRDGVECPYRNQRLVGAWEKGLRRGTRECVIAYRNTVLENLYD